MTDNTYNGWTNYATWRVNLELFDGLDTASDNNLDAYDLGQTLRDYAIEVVIGDATGLAYDYAMAFLDEVNWYEIATHMIDDYRTKEAD
jgi:hypothetical protein